MKETPQRLRSFAPPTRDKIFIWSAVIAGCGIMALLGRHAAITRFVKKVLKKRLKVPTYGQSNRNSEKANQQKKEFPSIPATRWTSCSSTSNGMATSTWTYLTELDL